MYNDYVNSEEYFAEMTNAGNLGDGTKYILVPKIVLTDSRLSPIEKLVYSYIANFDNRCWASNEHLAKLFSVSERTISRSVANLIKMEYIECLGFTGRFRLLRSCVDGSELRRMSGMDN